MRQAAGFLPSIVLATTFVASTGASAAPPATPATPTSRTPQPTRPVQHAPTAVVPASAAASTPASPLADACPAQLPVKQTVSEAIDGWTPVNQQGNYPFLRVAFYPGPPAESSLIVPSIEFKGAAGLHDGWDLPHRAGGYWMTCAYGNTTATVARKLADEVDFCQADYDGRFLTLVVRRWSCGVKRSMLAPVVARPAPRPVPKPAQKPAPVPAKPPYKHGD
jgi:hypothetical protein